MIPKPYNDDFDYNPISEQQMEDDIDFSSRKVWLDNIRKYAIVDVADFEDVSKYDWHGIASKSNENLFYAARWENVDGKATRVRMHRQIMGVSDSKRYVDHRDGDGLNNRRTNLRIATYSQNGANRKSSYSSTSSYLGVSERGGYYCANICKDDERVYLGIYRVEEDAAYAYNQKAIELHGEFAKLNPLPNGFVPTKRPMATKRTKKDRNLKAINSVSVSEKILEAEKFVDEYISKNGVSPTYKVVAEYLGVVQSAAMFRLRRYAHKMNTKLSSIRSLKLPSDCQQIINSAISGGFAKNINDAVIAAIRSFGNAIEGADDLKDVL